MHIPFEMDADKVALVNQTFTELLEDREMSNPCETPEQCLDALANLRVEANRVAMMQRKVKEELARIVLDEIARGKLPADIIQVNEQRLRVALHRRGR